MADVKGKKRRNPRGHFVTVEHKTRTTLEGDPLRQEILESLLADYQKQGWVLLKPKAEEPKEAVKVAAPAAPKA